VIWFAVAVSGDAGTSVGQGWQ